MELKDYLGIVVRRKILFLFTVIVCFGGYAFWASEQKTLYRASSRVAIRSGQNRFPRRQDRS